MLASPSLQTTLPHFVATFLQTIIEGKSQSVAQYTVPAITAVSRCKKVNRQVSGPQIQAAVPFLAFSPFGIPAV